MHKNMILSKEKILSKEVKHVQRRGGGGGRGTRVASELAKETV